MDVLSEVLKVIRLNAALFYNAEYSSPWSFRSPPSHLLGPYVSPDGGHVILYHLVTDGRAWFRLEGCDQVMLEAGDLVIFPHGDPHYMGNGPVIDPVDHGRELQRIFAQGLGMSCSGGGGEITRFVCGYLSCDPQLSRVLLAGLPRVIKVNIRRDQSGAWLENSIRFSVDQAASSAPGSVAVVAKLSEALFAETMRRYMSTLTPNETGWLAGARDPEVGRALGLLHRDPARMWTVAELAESVGLSRSVLAERFRHYLGEPPMAYLTRWRLHLGARLLATTSQSVAKIGMSVGYDSEAAFNRAFKRELGEPPARFRKNSKSAKTTASGA